MIKLVSSELIKSDLKELYTSKIEFEKKIGPSRNKLQRCLMHPQMRRIMGLRENNIDVDAMIEQKGTLLAPLQPSDTDLLGRDNMRALGTLLISELWESFRKRTKPQEFYLIVDEMTEFMTPDLIEILPRAAGYGLHCCLAYQDKGQLSPALASAIKNAQTKIYFSTEDDPKKQRRFTFRKADHSTAEVIAPLMDLWQPPAEKIEARIEDLVKNFLTPEEVDSRLGQPQNKSKADLEDTDDGWAIQ